MTDLFIIIGAIIVIGGGMYAFIQWRKGSK